MTAVSWPVCMLRAAGRMPTHDAPRTMHASMRVWRCARRVRVRCRGLGAVCRGAVRRSVLVLLTGLMLVSFLPILDLGLEHFGWNAGRVLEHEPAAQHAGPDQSEESHNAQHACERELLRRHLKTSEQTPSEH